MKQKLIFLAALFAAAFSFSAEYYVDASRADDTGSATNLATAKQTIQAAVDLTIDGDTVWVTNGTYRLSSEISVTNAIAVQSVNGRAVTTVDGGGSNRCFKLFSDCLISGFSIRNGFACNGAGVFCSGDNPVVSNCVFDTNITTSEEVPYGMPTYGGGMYDGSAYECVFRNNSACYGGGLSYGIAIACVFSNNTVKSASLQNFAHGAGQYKGEAVRCVFVGNSSDFVGGGISLGSASDCLFFNNSAAAYGGGTSSSAVSNCTVVHNSAYGGGGMAAGSVGETTSVAYNCVFLGNTATEEGDDFWHSQAYNSCSLELMHGMDGNITNAPQFVDAAGGDFRLQSNSPCINWGNNSVVSNAMDLDGNPRIGEDVVDMGAYEYQSLLGLTDSDGDGILDDWERQHGGNQNPERICSNGVNTVRQASEHLTRTKKKPSIVTFGEK